MAIRETATARIERGGPSPGFVVTVGDLLRKLQTSDTKCETCDAGRALTVATRGGTAPLVICLSCAYKMRKGGPLVRKQLRSAAARGAR